MPINIGIKSKLKIPCPLKNYLIASGKSFNGINVKNVRNCIIFASARKFIKFPENNAAEPIAKTVPDLN